MRSSLAFLCLLLAACLSSFCQQASTAAPVSSATAVPHLVRFTGQLKNASGTVGITFTLHKSQQDEAALWMETQNVQLDSTGKYTVLLGATKSEGIPAELFTSGDAQWLGIRVEGRPDQPRVLLVSVPYALKAAEADTLAGHAANDFVTTDKLSSAVQQQLEAASAPAATAHKNSVNKNGVPVDGATNFTDTTTSQVVLVTQQGAGAGLVATAGNNYALSGTSTNTAIYGSSNGATHATAAALEGVTTASQGRGIFGWANTTTGVNFGLYGQANSVSGTGIAAASTAISGTTVGLEAQDNSPAGTAAVIQARGGGKIISGQTGSSNTEVFSVDGSGNVWSAASATFLGNGSPVVIGNMNCGAPGYSGISFTTPATCSNAILFTNSVTTMLQAPAGGGITFQQAGTQLAYIGDTGGFYVYGPTGDYDGIDAYGHTDYSASGVSTSGASFIGGSNSTGGSPGVRGVGGYNGGQGVFAEGGFGADGLYAEPGSFGTYAGNFNGDLNVSGKITAGTKDFKIDHPLDPANKYLYHASVESSEMKNIYDGLVTFDDAGNATVQLPDWFEAENTDFRYQLTPVGAAFTPFIAEKISGNRFKISGGLPGKEVSWQVTGVRQDAYAKANPLQVEVAKPERERGYYIHPELYGAAPEKQIEWSRSLETMKHARELPKPRAPEKIAAK